MSKGRHRTMIAIKLDGVVNSFRSGWTGGASFPDEPTPGAFEYIEHLLNQGHDVIIFSRRFMEHCAREAFADWMCRTPLGTRIYPQLRIESRMPRASLVIDDKCQRFTGHWPTDTEIRSRIRPWNTQRRLDEMRGKTKIINLMDLPVKVAGQVFEPSTKRRKPITIHTELTPSERVKAEMGLPIWEETPVEVHSLPEPEKYTMFIVPRDHAEAARQIGRPDFLVLGGDFIEQDGTYEAESLIRLLPYHTPAAS